MLLVKDQMFPPPERLVRRRKHTMPVVIVSFFIRPMQDYFRMLFVAPAFLPVKLWCSQHQTRRFRNRSTRSIRGRALPLCGVGADEVAVLPNWALVRRLVPALSSEAKGGLYEIDNSC